MKTEINIPISFSVDREKTISTINNYLDFLKKEEISRKEISDGYHTFGELYYHRMILFSLLLNSHADISWKAKKHHDGTMFDEESFICGIETPEGQYTYHYHLRDWDMFKVKELEFAPKYDGHKPSDIKRLLSLNANKKNEVAYPTCIDEVLIKKIAIAKKLNKEGITIGDVTIKLIDK